MTKFADSLNFSILLDGLKSLGIDSSWCQNKTEAVNAIYLFFDKYEMELEYNCPKCGGDLPEVELCPFCGEVFTDPVSQDTDTKNIPEESMKYGSISVYKFKDKLHFSSAESFGMQAWETIKSTLMVPEVLIYKHKNREQYTIKNPFSEHRDFQFKQALVMVEVHKKSLAMYLTFHKEQYINHSDAIEELNVPIRRLVSKFVIRDKEQLLDGIDIIAETFKLSKLEHEKD